MFNSEVEYEKSNHLVSFLLLDLSSVWQLLPMQEAGGGASGELAVVQPLVVRFRGSTVRPPTEQRTIITVAGVTTGPVVFSTTLVFAIFLSYQPS